MQLVVVLVRLELRDLLLPVGIQDVAIVAREALVDLRWLVSATVSALNVVASYILPRAREELRIWRMALGGNLDQISAWATGRGRANTYCCGCACDGS